MQNPCCSFAFEPNTLVLKGRSANELATLLPLQVSETCQARTMYLVKTWNIVEGSLAPPSPTLLKVKTEEWHECRSSWLVSSTSQVGRAGSCRPWSRKQEQHGPEKETEAGQGYRQQSATTRQQGTELVGKVTPEGRPKSLTARQSGTKSTDRDKSSKLAEVRVIR